MSDMGNPWRERFRKKFKVVFSEKAKKGSETKQDGYPSDWARVTLMVSPDGKLVHAIGGDREAGAFIGLERLNNYFKSISTPVSDKLDAISETLSRIDAKSTQNLNKVRLWFDFYCKAINQIDDYFEYTAERQSPEEIKKRFVKF